MNASARLIAVLLALALPAGVAAQAAGGLALRHGFPEAGGSVRLLVEGLTPGAPVIVQLRDPDLAPPSVPADLYALWPEFTLSEGQVSWSAVADPFGLLDVVVQLDDPADAGRLAVLRFDALDGRTAEARLLVQAPTLLVATGSGLERVDLRDGARLAPAVPAAGGLADAALSADGLQLHVLRDDGALERRSAEVWDGPALGVERFDPSGDDLARARDAGALFVVESPPGAPFAPSGRLAFPGGDDVLGLSPMGQEVSGRRWALHPDGGTAFVAEDDLLVREVDLHTRQAWRPLPVGAPGDDAIADLVVQGDRLLVATRRSGGLSGSLSVLDLVSGQLTVELLSVDPARLLVVDDHDVLVVPAAGGRVLQVIEDGVPMTETRPGPALLDAATIPGGALMLGRADDGSHPLLRWSDGGLVPLGVGAPGAGRLYTAGHAVAVLVADDGALWRVLVDEARLEPVGVTAEPGTRAVVLP